MKRNSPYIAASVLLALIVFASGCSLGGLLRRTSAVKKTVTSSDGFTQITVPGDWKVDADLNEEASLQMSNRIKELYIIVLTENREDFSPDVDLKAYSELTRASLSKNITGLETSLPTRTEINGCAALQSEIRGTVGNVNLVYIHVSVETRTRYHQVLAWTLRSRFEQNKPVLQEVVNSFREVDAGGGSANPAPSK